MRPILFFVILFLISCTKESSLPSRYDSRVVGAVSSFKEQSWGTCWAFATVSTLESNLLRGSEWSKSGESSQVDLSEYHLDKFNGFNRSGREGDRQEGWYSGQGEKFIGSNHDEPDDGLVVHLGGDYQVSSAYLLSVGGAVQERLTPAVNNRDYNSFGNTPSDGVLLKNNYKYFLPRDMEWLSFSGSDEEKREKVKKAIMKYGAVASSQNMRDEPLAIASDGLEIHMNVTEKKLNHAVSLVGWDDSIVYKNHKGAWIVKDSDHKDEKTGKHIGIFYIMYDDLHAAKDKYMGAIAFSNIKENSFKDILTHSLHGWRYNTNDNLEYIRSVFKMSRDGNLSKVGYVSLDKDNEVNLDIFVNKKKVTELNFRHSEVGIFVRDLEGVAFKEGDLIEIYQRNTSGKYGFDGSFMMEVLLGKLPKWGDPVSVSSRAQPGEAFYKLKGLANERDFSQYAQLDWIASKKEKDKVSQTASPTLFLFLD